MIVCIRQCAVTCVDGRQVQRPLTRVNARAR